VDWLAQIVLFPDSLSDISMSMGVLESARQNLFGKWMGMNFPWA